MHPFLDVSKLSDEEIIEKLGKAYSHMNSQVALGHTPTVQSIKDVIQSLELERESRMTKIIREEYKRKYPMDNNAIELGKLED